MDKWYIIIGLLLLIVLILAYFMCKRYPSDVVIQNVGKISSNVKYLSDQASNIMKNKDELLDNVKVKVEEKLEDSIDKNSRKLEQYMRKNKIPL